MFKYSKLIILTLIFSLVSNLSISQGYKKMSTEELNNIPLYSKTSFGFSEELEMLYYRCVVPCPNKPFDQEIHLNNVFVLIYLLDNFSFFIEAISNGLKTFEECCHEIKRIKHIE